MGRIRSTGAFPPSSWERVRFPGTFLTHADETFTSTVQLPSRMFPE